jgi:hypothetical protein
MIKTIIGYFISKPDPKLDEPGIETDPSLADQPNHEEVEPTIGDILSTSSDSYEYQPLGLDDYME